MYQDQQSLDFSFDHEYFHLHVFLSNLYMFFSIVLRRIFNHEDSILQNQAQQWKETQNLHKKIVLRCSYLISFLMQIFPFLKNDIDQHLEFSKV
jgi:hypothetical protein